MEQWSPQLLFLCYVAFFSCGNCGHYLWHKSWKLCALLLRMIGLLVCLFLTDLGIKLGFCPSFFSDKIIKSFISLHMLMNSLTIKTSELPSCQAHYYSGQGWQLPASFWWLFFVCLVFSFIIICPVFPFDSTVFAVCTQVFFIAVPFLLFWFSQITLNFFICSV